MYKYFYLLGLVTYNLVIWIVIFMILFIISLICICISSCFFASAILNKSPKIHSYNVSFLIYTLLLIFAQVVFSFELLSLFNSISQEKFLILNILFLTISYIIWKKNGSSFHFLKEPVVREAKKIKQALLKDKSLVILFGAWCFFIFTALIMSFLLPANAYDSLSYHLARVPFWISNGNLNHFDTPEARMLVMPINSELLYSWVFLFFKQDWGIGFFSFCGYVLAIFNLYQILGELNFATRPKLWAVFMISSMTSVIVEASGAETDVLLGGLLLSAIYLFIRSVKTGSKSDIFFSSLAYALAVGTKSPAVMSLASFVFLSVAIFLCFKNAMNFKEKLRIYKYFVVFFALNFLLFSSFNYILNFINYGNPLGAASVIAKHEFFGGYKAFIANLIKYFFMLFDTSGFIVSKGVTSLLNSIQSHILDLMRIPQDLGVVMVSDKFQQGETTDPIVGMGILGFLLFLPMVFLSIFLFFNKSKSNKTRFIGAFSVAFLINLIVLSFSVGFMPFSIRFITFFAVVSSPILAFTYIRSNKNVFKWIILYYSISYLLVISSHLTSRPFFKLSYIFLNQSNSIESFRDRVRCSEDFDYSNQLPACIAKRVIQSRVTSIPFEKFSGVNPIMPTINLGSNFKKIALITTVDFRVYPLKLLESQGFKVDLILLQDIKKYDMSKYDFIVTNNLLQNSSVVKYYNPEDLGYTYGNRTLAFKRNNIANCYYVSRDKQIISETNKNKSKAAFSVCYMPVPYFEAKGFRQIAKIRVYFPNPLHLDDVIVYEKF